jgi:hypothetical protein
VIRSSPMPSATTRARRPAIHITGESSRGVKAHNLATNTKDGQQSSHTVPPVTSQAPSNSESQMVPNRESSRQHSDGNFLAQEALARG